MRLPSYRTLALVGVIAASSFDHAGAFGTRRDEYAEYQNRSVRVVRVPDAATVEIDLPDGQATTTLVRLCGVNLPDEPNDEVARRWLRDETRQGRVRLVLDDRRPLRDAGRHLIAYVWRDDDSGLLFNEEMIRVGYAPADRDGRYGLRLRFFRQEDAAKRRGSGIWEAAREGRRRGRR